MQISVVIFLRPKRPQAFSIERVVERFTQALPEDIRWRVVTLPYPRTHPWDWIRNGLAARKEKADVYHISGESHYLVFFLPRKRTVLTIHDCIVLDRLRGLKKLFMRWFFFALPAAWAGAVTTISQASLDQLRKWSRLRLVDARIVYDPLMFEQEPAEHIPDPEKPFTFMTIGTKENKNIPRCIEAAKSLPCRFLMVGRLNKELENMLGNSGVEYENRYDLTDQELKICYLKSDALLFPSLEEGFGMPILEAQAMNTPVITSNCSSMPEIAGEGAALVDPENATEIRSAIIKIMEDPVFVERLCAKGIENIPRFNPKRIAGEYAEIYIKSAHGSVV